MRSNVPWPPQVGELLPRAAEAYAAPEKIAWILSDAGHGKEWTRVLHIGSDDTQRFWEAIAKAVLDKPILAIRDISPHGVNYEVRIELTLGDRTAATVTIWHYASPDDAPRLVTAYPTP
jgi:hypothetical protein